ncbi:MAG: polyphosphate:AMP phosphotransferase [Paenalcaligenes sp.]
MFEDAENDPCLSKEEAQPLIAELRTALQHQQYRRLHEQKQSLLIVVAGLDGAGKGSAINQLNTWLDPRYVHTLAYGKLTSGEAMRPAMWRYWRDLPAKGSIGVVFGSWYASLLSEAVRKRPDHDKIMLYSTLINRFEAMLAAENVQVVKLWYHLSKQAQHERTQRLLADPAMAWRVTKADLKVQKKFQRLRHAAHTTLELTNRSYAPWVVVPSADDTLRSVRTAEVVLQALQQPSGQVIHTDEAPAWPMAAHKATLREVDYRTQLKKDNYAEQLSHWQGRLAQVVRSDAFKERSLVLAFEGQDAAGKGGAIRRVTEALDIRSYAVHPISAPSAEELSRPYLWRFWRSLPRHGHAAIFDRTWYGRVLVERVEKLISPTRWRQAYDEINSFESQMVANGTVVIKFWLAVSKAEQLRRFQEREDSPFKQYKITEDDWRNRSKWLAYHTATEDMLAHTNTLLAPWYVIPANDKRYARVEVLKNIVLTLEGLDKQKVLYSEPPVPHQSSEIL